jgi:hypothetical protein
VIRLLILSVPTRVNVDLEAKNNFNNNPQPTMEKPAPADHKLDDLIARRWSPRAFSGQPIEDEKLLSLLEAARWSASSFNDQPWNFMVAVKPIPLPIAICWNVWCLAIAPGHMQLRY